MHLAYLSIAAYCSNISMSFISVLNKMFIYLSMFHDLALYKSIAEVCHEYLFLEGLFFCQVFFWVVWSVGNILSVTDVETTGSSNEFYDKFGIRYHISVIMKGLWDRPIHRASIIQESRSGCPQNSIAVIRLFIGMVVFSSLLFFWN